MFLVSFSVGGIERPKISFEYMTSPFNPALAGVSSHYPVSSHLPLAGGGGSDAPCLTRERLIAAGRATRRSKSLDETVFKCPLNFPNEVTCQVKVRSNVKIGVFRLRAVKT